MLAWMNREALELTLSEGRAVYWSALRQASGARARSRAMCNS